MHVNVCTEAIAQCSLTHYKNALFRVCVPCHGITTTFNDSMRESKREILRWNEFNELAIPSKKTGRVQTPSHRITCVSLSIGACEARRAATCAIRRPQFQFVDSRCCFFLSLSLSHSIFVCIIFNLICSCEKYFGPFVAGAAAVATVCIDDALWKSFYRSELLLALLSFNFFS